MSRGGRGLLATPAGAVACELEPLGLDDAGARYELRITNGTPGVLAATVSAVRLDETRPVAALAVEVQPHAALRTGFALDAKLPYERVTAEVRGEGIHMIVEAPPPRGGGPGGANPREREAPAAAGRAPAPPLGRTGDRARRRRTARRRDADRRRGRA